jgi:hypothetical protein
MKLAFNDSLTLRAAKRWIGRLSGIDKQDAGSTSSMYRISAAFRIALLKAYGRLTP